jgi:hypothetical protein
MANTTLTASAIADYYGKYFKYKTTKPCADVHAKNQCAVRLSLALEGLSPGFLDDFDPANRVHRNRNTCMNLPPHVLGAAELGNYLSQQWGVPFGYHGADKLRAREVLRARPGVIWFEKCYTTSAGTESDHVDFWTGWHYMNELFKVSAGGNADAGDDLFKRSNGVIRFFSLVS